jgi:hypothetical protein
MQALTAPPAWADAAGLAAGELAAGALAAGLAGVLAAALVGAAALVAGALVAPLGLDDLLLHAASAIATVPIAATTWTVFFTTPPLMPRWL